MKNKIPDAVLREIFQRKLKKKSVNGEVYDRLKKMILAGKLKKGQRLVQEGIALHFNVSRQTVRNAFVRLEKEKLIKGQYRRGVVVS